MKVYEIREPSGIDNLKLADRPDPTPGHGQIVVRVKASSLNYRDYMTVKNGGTWVSKRHGFPALMVRVK